MIRITTLGDVRIHRDDTVVVDLPAQKLRFALLVYLACERDVSRDEVVAMFWPDRDAARGKHALRQMLYELRAVLGDDWAELHRERIVCGAEVDALEFEAAAEAGRIDDAIAAYGGPFMAGFGIDSPAFEGWVERRRAHLIRIHRRLQRDQVAALTSARRFEEAIASARRWVEMDPLDDEAAHALIECLAAAGQRNAALQYFDSYERQLRAELDVEPLDSTRALVDSLRRGEVGAPAGPPSSASAAEHVVSTHAPAPAADAGVVRAGRTLRMTSVRRRVAVAAISAVALASTALLALDPGGARQQPLPRQIDLTVLPFDDASADSSLDVLAEELGLELARSLGRSSIINVTSPEGVRLLREKGVSEDSVGRMLGADYLVSGRISRTGHELRFVLSLLDGRSGQLVRDTTLARVQSESRNLIPDVVDAAALFLRDEVGTRLDVSRGRAATKSERAWQHVLQGKRLLASTTSMFHTRDYALALRTAIEADSQFARAARLDGRWAEPLIMRARAQVMAAMATETRFGNDPAARVRHLRAGLDLVNAALRRSPEAAEAYELKGRMLESLAGVEPDSAAARATREAALRALDQAVDLDPLLQYAWTRLALQYVADQRWAEAKAAAVAGYQADPYSQAVQGLINILFVATFEIGEDEQAQSWCAEGLARYSDLPPFAACALTMHAWSDFVDANPQTLRTVMTRVPVARLEFLPHVRDQWDAMLAAAFARAGEPDSARAILARLERSEEAHTIAVVAAAWMRLGDVDTAMHHVRRYVSHPEFRSSALRRRMFWQFRDVPEFARLAAR